MKAYVTELKNTATDLLDTINKLKSLLSRLEAENIELLQRVERLEKSNAKLNEDMTNLFESLASGRIC